MAVVKKNAVGEQISSNQAIDLIPTKWKLQNSTFPNLITWESKPHVKLHACDRR